MKLLILLATIALAACSEDAPPRDDGDRDADAEEAPRTDASSGDAATRDGADAGRDGAASDASRDGSSAADSAARVDAGSERDADAPSDDDASTAGDAGAVGGDAGARGSWQARSCGAETSFPSPLPPSGSRAAKRVGSDRFGFLEGPVWIAELDVLLFTDINMSGGNENGPPARIRRLTPPMAFDVFAESGNSNGLAVFEGKVYAASHDTQSLSTFDPESGARTDLMVRYGDKRFNSPNDLAIRGDGTIYFTDPDWQLGARTSEIGKMGVYRVPPGSGATRAAELIDDTLQKPNGIALSPDERTLYVGSAASEVWKYTVADDGSVSGRTKFADTGPSDGMTVDCAGNLYVTSGTVEVFAPSGMKLGDITVPEGPANVAFGGADAKTLYITAQTGLYSIALMVPGAPY